MNCQAPLPADDDGQFEPDDSMLPLGGVEPRVEGSDGGAGDTAFVIVAWVVLAIGCGLATVALVMQ